MPVFSNKPVDVDGTVAEFLTHLGKCELASDRHGNLTDDQATSLLKEHKPHVDRLWPIVLAQPLSAENVRALKKEMRYCNWHVAGINIGEVVRSLETP